MGKRKTTPPKSVLPVMLLAAGRPCLVVGGGEVAERKVAALLAAEAKVTVIAPRVTDALWELSRSGQVAWQSRVFLPADVAGQWLVIAATDEPITNAIALMAARGAGVLATSADSQWQVGDFMMPATFTVDGITVALSSGGASPARVARLRRELERYFAKAAPADESAAADEG
jgi:siroheme synthase-like protein